MKKFIFCLLLIVLLPAGAACSTAKDTPQVNIAVLRGPTGIGAAWLMEESESGQKNYNFHLTDNPEQVVALLANGTVDMAALPTNLAANLYAKTEGQIRMTAIIARGVLYMLQAGDAVQNWEDLRGRTIYATARGSNPEYILYHLLQEHGLQPGRDVQVEFKNDHAELATLLATGQVDLAMLPEPFVTSALMQNDNLSMVFDLSAEWEALGTGSLAMTALVAQNSFIAAEPDSVATLMADMEQSVNYAVNNVSQAAALCEKHGIIPKAAVAEQAIPRCNLNLTFITGEDMQGAIAAYFDVLYQAAPQSMGGALPDGYFYYTR
ncbi:MAG: PhnD/SsuA/transferrin family substrate-binding protein [Clostridiales bacterium]|nr:PhnD/SsuA/transferrin family substrate-binding protein [Clostridiales bacterium]